MKKLIPLFFALVLLVGCAKNYTPTLNTDFQMNAVYKIGDFSFVCEISKDENVVSVTPTSTNAKGMTITYDGTTAVFKYKNFEKSLDNSKVDSTNPAVLIYDVFNYLELAENLQVKRVDNTFEYYGKVPIGDFVLVQNSDNSLKSLSLPTADVYIEFENATNCNSN